MFCISHSMSATAASSPCDCPPMSSPNFILLSCVENLKLKFSSNSFFVSSSSFGVLKITSFSISLIFLLFLLSISSQAHFCCSFCHFLFFWCAEITSIFSCFGGYLSLEGRVPLPLHLDNRIAGS